MLSVNGKQRKAHLHHHWPRPSPLHLRLNDRVPQEPVTCSLPIFPSPLSPCSSEPRVLPGRVLQSQPEPLLLKLCCVSPLLLQQRCTSSVSFKTLLVALMMTMSRATRRDSQDLLFWPFFTEQREGRKIHLGLTSQATMAVMTWHSGTWDHLPTLFVSCLCC